MVMCHAVIQCGWSACEMGKAVLTWGCSDEMLRSRQLVLWSVTLCAATDLCCLDVLDCPVPAVEISDPLVWD